MTDIATRVHDHTWRIDPIVRSLLDTDFYKLLMLQTVYRRHADVRVKFSLINRSAHLPLAWLIDEGDLVVIIAGSPPGIPGSTNALRIHRMGDAINEVAPAYRRS